MSGTGAFNYLIVRALPEARPPFWGYVGADAEGGREAEATPWGSRPGKL